MSNIKVTVQDANNVLLEVTPVPIQQIAISRGVAGRGISDVQAVEINNALYLEFFFTDGTTEIVGPVGTIQYIGESPIVVDAATISLDTVPISFGGTGQVTANAGFNALAPTQTGNAGKYLKTDGTNSAWDLIDISTADITGVLPIANGGTNATTAAGAMVNLLPSYTGNANKRLGLNSGATGLEWVTDGGGTVTSIDLSGGTTGLSFTGGPVTTSGTITLSGTLDVDNGGTGATTAAGARTNLNAADQALILTAGTGLSGGGDLTANRSFSITNTGVTAASYGAASKTLTATVNAQGQLTVLADTPIAIANTQISGLGTMSTQNASSVAITGGSITGITDLAVADGGTGASDASGARTNLGAAASATTISAGTGLSGGGDLSANRTLSIANTAVTAGSYGSASNTLTATVNAQGQLTALAATPIAIANTQISGLGTMSTQNSNSVTITGGSITGITDLAIADGGTGASTASGARSNLGLGTAAVLDAGVANGVATLDGSGTIPLSQIPASIQGGVSYQGSWNAATNTPTLTSSVGSKGYYYVVSVAGSTNLNGVTDWLVGDWAIFNGSIWQKIDNTDSVASVNGYTGAVVLTNTDVGAPSTSLTISAGTGLTGGGDLSTNRTLSIANTTVTAASYGSASAVPTFTVNGQGQLTAASNTTIAIANTQVSGLGTMSTQNANSVSITGGSITGITDLAIADGGTGASTAADARTNLGVTATGQDTTYLYRANNLSDLANAATARTNLGLGTAATQNSTAFATAAQGALADTAIQTLTSTDGSVTITPTGTSRDLSVAMATSATNVLCQVRNTTGATLTKGTVVYISGATGQIPTVSKALATSDATSAQTLGMMTADLANNTNGYVTIIGLITNINTSSYTDGQQLYLSGTTAGAVTATKPYAPIHLVYVAVVEYAHPVNGKLFVKVQNGYELDEIHNVSAQTPSNGQTIVYNSSNQLWENNTVSLTLGVNGVLPIANGGTGQTNANAAFNALAPSQTGNSGKYLTTDGTNTSWATNPLGTVTSVAATVPSFLSISGSPITTSGTLAFGLSGIALPTTSGGTGLTSFTANGVVYASSTSALATGSALTFDGTNLTVGTGASTYKLNVYGASSPYLGVSDGTINTFFGAATGGSVAALGTTSNHPVSFYSNSAEQMRLTTTGLGIGTSSPATKLEVTGDIGGTWTVGATRFVGSQYLTGSAYQLGMKTTMDTRETQIFAKAADTGGYVTIATGTTPTERVRVDGSGNVGIGTNSPLGRLDVRSTNGVIGVMNTTVSAPVGTTAQISLLPNSAFTGAWANGPSIKGYLENATNFATAITINPYNGSTGQFEAARFDSAGNFGLRVTPSAWVSSFRAFQIGDQSALVGYNGNFTWLGTNWVSTATGDKYITNGYATIYRQNDGSHAWYIAPSGTAGLGVSFTQAMTLTSGGALGIGTTSPARPLDVNGSVRIADSAVVEWGGVSTAIAGSSSANTLFFFTASTERARIDSSGNVGIGTSSPTQRLEVSFNDTTTNRTSPLNVAAITATSSNVAGAPYTGFGPALVFRSQSYNGTIYNGPRVRMVIGDDSISTTAGSSLAFDVTATKGASPTQAAIIDSSGNLGLGVTPSAWAGASVNYNTFQFGVSSVTNVANVAAEFAYNQYIDSSGTRRYISTNTALRYRMGTTDHAWFTASSGTAGTAISFTQAMTLNASGNLVVGATVAEARLQASTSNPTNGVVQLLQNLSLSSQTGAKTQYDVGNVGTSGLGIPDGSSNALAFFVGGMTSASERVRIDSSGNLLVGNPSAPQISAGGTGTVSSIALSASGTAIAASLPASATGYAVRSQSVTAAGTGWMHFYGASGNGSTLTTNSIYIYGNGNIQNANNSYGAISDIKLKENIVDASPKLDKLMQVRVRNYNLKGDYEQHKQIGVVAQELETVFPSMIEETVDKDVEGNDLGTTTKSVKYSVFVPMLIKAIQEQQEIIESLKARLDAANL